MLRSQKRVESFHVAGRPLRCQICQRSEFWHRRAQLNTAWLTFMNLDWANRTADCYVCNHCGYVHWFVQSTED